MGGFRVEWLARNNHKGTGANGPMWTPKVGLNIMLLRSSCNDIYERQDPLLPQAKAFGVFYCEQQMVANLRSSLILRKEQGVEAGVCSRQAVSVWPRPLYLHNRHRQRGHVNSHHLDGSSLCPQYCQKHKQRPRDPPLA
eukprot:1196278-Prorocentrum_minimum.AAC.2